ncbi:unnamed protein product [Amoebophrya sp. A120]|nr:unnamed protein product [Amoebophrya sp. A120]|eukprot:GSA120T00000324001.1
MIIQQTNEDNGNIITFTRSRAIDEKLAMMTTSRTCSIKMHHAHMRRKRSIAASVVRWSLFHLQLTEIFILLLLPGHDLLRTSTPGVVLASSFRGWVNPLKYQSFDPATGEQILSLFPNLNDGENVHQVEAAIQSHAEAEHLWRVNLVENRQRSLVGATDCDLGLSTTEYLPHFELLLNSTVMTGNTGRGRSGKKNTGKRRRGGRGGGASASKDTAANKGAASAKSSKAAAAISSAGDVVEDHDLGDDNHSENEDAVATTSSSRLLTWTFLNIGAYDGVSEDPVYPVVKKFPKKMRGLYVEKDPEMCKLAARNLFPTTPQSVVLCVGLTPRNVVPVVKMGARVLFEEETQTTSAPGESKDKSLRIVHEEEVLNISASKTTTAALEGLSSNPVLSTSSTSAGLDGLHFDLIKIDIDSYDADLLDALLRHGFSAKHFLLEVNPGIPPPHKFATRFHPKLFDAMLQPEDEIVGKRDSKSKSKRTKTSPQKQNDLLTSTYYEEADHDSDVDHSKEVVKSNSEDEPEISSRNDVDDDAAPVVYKMHNWPLRGMSLSYAVSVMATAGYDFVTFGYHDAYFVNHRYREIYNFKAPYDEFDCFHKAFITMNGILIRQTRDWFYRLPVENAHAEIFKHMVKHSLTNTGGKYAFPFSLSY